VGLLAAAFALAAFSGAAWAAGGTVSGKVTATPAKYLEETVVYIQEVPGTSPTPRSAGMDQKGMKFLPHILVVAKGDTVRFLNHDTVAHNVYTPDFEAYNLGTFKPGETRTHVFSDTTGVYTQLCSIHPEMIGYIFVGQNRYAGTVDAQGHYSLKDVPPGTYTVSIWNSKLKAADQSVTVEEGKPVEVNFNLQR
jgi:plastocyanin